METITGRAGEVFVVLGNDIWKGKTNFLRQVEAIAYSLEFLQQNINDKINKS
jgi:hypothetical protein